jgi:hypothetical protein
MFVGENNGKGRKTGKKEGSEDKYGRGAGWLRLPAYIEYFWWNYPSTFYTV